jgi:hypothetical protein
MARPVDPSKLQAVEDRLLDEAVDHHPHAEAALDHALDDMASLSAQVQHSRRRPLLLRSTTSLNRIEDLLLEAIVRTHPNRERALDRLMGDVAVSSNETVAVAVAERGDPDAAEFDTAIDNDFDGWA